MEEGFGIKLSPLLTNFMRGVLFLLILCKGSLMMGYILDFGKMLGVHIFLLW